MSYGNTKCQTNKIPWTFLSVAWPFVFGKDGLYMYGDLVSSVLRLCEYLDKWILADSGHCSRYTYTVPCISWHGNLNMDNRQLHLYFCCVVVYHSLNLCDTGVFVWHGLLQFYKVTVKASFQKAFWIEVLVAVLFPCLMAAGAKI